jgi:hypothetical protein
MRVVLVWEGVCAEPPSGKARDRLSRLRGDWGRIVRSWTIHEKPLQRIAWADARDMPVDIVTFEGEEYCEALVERLDRMHVAVARVDWYEDAQAFARDLRVSRDIQYVVDSDPARLALYGRRALAVNLGDDWGQLI